MTIVVDGMDTGIIDVAVGWTECTIFGCAGAVIVVTVETDVDVCIESGDVVETRSGIWTITGSWYGIGVTVEVATRAGDGTDP